MKNVHSLTLKDLRQIRKILGVGGSEALIPIQEATVEVPGPWKLGANYFVRTVTHHLTGRLTAIHAQELVLEDAAWIPCDGRFMNALEKCDFEEVEPFPKGPVIIGRASVIDAKQITKIPTSQK